jgi:hypothetical protein
MVCSRDLTGFHGSATTADTTSGRRFGQNDPSPSSSALVLDFSAALDKSLGNSSGWRSERVGSGCGPSASEMAGALAFLSRAVAPTGAPPHHPYPQGYPQGYFLPPQPPALSRSRSIGEKAAAEAAAAAAAEVRVAASAEVPGSPSASSLAQLEREAAAIDSMLDLSK